MASATYLDICANPCVVKEVSRYTSIPLCISSISLNDFYSCTSARVQVFEIGNYDFYYKHRVFLSKSDILSLVVDMKRIFPNFDICVTIPYSLSLFEQIELARSLETIGIQILQTESIKLHLKLKNISLTQLINLSFPVLSSTYVISKAVKIPVLAASGMNYITASLARLYGAKGIGVGSSINQYCGYSAKYVYLKEVIESLKFFKVIISKSKISSMQVCRNFLI